VIIDDYSRTIASFRVGFEAPSALGTALALRQGIWRKQDPHWQICGIPDVFYTDHGSDFTSDHLKQVAVDLKMQLVFSTVGEPRGRGRVERFFETVNQLCLSDLPGYRPSDSPLGTPLPTPVLTLAQLEERLQDFFLGNYHQRIHGETGVAPQARWEAGGFLPRLPGSLEQLDLLLLTVTKARRIHQDGIRFQGLRYLDLTLAAYVGESVIIRYDHATWPRSGSTTRTASSVGRSARSWLARPSASRRSSRPAGRVNASSVRVWCSAAPSSPHSCHHPRSRVHPIRLRLQRHHLD
jgi:putative transposase